MMMIKISDLYPQGKEHFLDDITIEEMQTVNGGVSEETSVTDITEATALSDILKMRDMQIEQIMANLEQITVDLRKKLLR